MSKPKYRIVKVTESKDSSWYEIQERCWFNHWSCAVNDFPQYYDGALDYSRPIPHRFKTLEDAESVYSKRFAKHKIEVIKEYGQ